MKDVKVTISVILPYRMVRYMRDNNVNILIRCMVDINMRQCSL